MNYIELVEKNAVPLRYQGVISLDELGLYVMLIHISNSLFWKNPFDATNPFVVGLIGKDEKTLIRMRNKLKQVGLIDFEPGAKGKPTRYRIIAQGGAAKPVGISGDFPVNPSVKSAVKSAVNPPAKPPDNNKQKQKPNFLDEPKKNEEHFSEERAGNDILPTSRSGSPSKPEFHAKPNHARSLTLEELLNDFEIQKWNIPHAYVEAWWMKYESEGWVTGGEYPKPIAKPGLKIAQHWRVGEKLMPNGGKYGDESTYTPQWNGRKNGYNPNEELSIEFGGARYTYKRGDCNPLGEIVNQDHPFFNEIQMAQMMTGTMMNGKGAVH